MRNRRGIAIAIMLAVAGGFACSDDEEDGGATTGGGPDQPFGESAIVTVVNPVVNDAHTTAVVAALSDERASIPVDANPGGAATTDATGLATVKDISAGPLSLIFGGGPDLPMTVVADGDVYDLAVGYNGDAVEAFENFPIRYGVGGQIVEFDTTAAPASVAEQLATSGNIVFFRNGKYVGDLLITGDNVIFFGEGFTERQVIIDGSITVKGTGVRIRSFTITGGVTVEGNEFGMAFNVVLGATRILGNGFAGLRNSFCGSVEVPSSNASLLDNEGMAPMAAPAAATCAPPPP